MGEIQLNYNKFLKLKLMKKIILFISVLFVFNNSFGQIAAVKKFDYTILKDKVLYIPTYEVSEKYISKMSKRGKFDKISDKKTIVEHYNTAWKEAMAESSYEATDYEIRSFDHKKVIKSKDEKAVLLYYYTDRYNNRQVELVVTAPKKKVIARSIITGLDLSDKNDIRLMMNMLNESLNTASELNEEGKKASRRGAVDKYKRSLVEWYEGIEDKTFLVPKSEHKNEKKAANRNEDLKAAIKNWKLSKYEFTTEEEVNNKRIEGDPDSYYWKTFRVYTSSSLIILNYNLLLSTEGDDIIMAFLGKNRLKPSTLEQIQKKIVAKVERYKNQLAN